MGELTVEWLLPDGRGAGRDEDGRVVRVRGALPGDRVRWAPADEPGGQPSLVEVCTPSAHRRASPCPWSDRCGGCDLDALQPSARCTALAATVAHALGLPEPPEVVPSPRAVGHRARIKLAIDNGKVGYRAHRSHDLVPVQTCRVARPEVQEGLQRLRTWMLEVPDGAVGLRDVELRSDGSRCVFSWTSDRKRPPAPVRAALADLGDVALDGKRVAGDPVLTLEVDEVPLRAGPRAFYQVNLEGNAALVEWVRDRALEVQPERVLDLYAGIGNLSLPLARRGIPVLAVESEGQAIEGLKSTAKRRRWCHVQAHVARVERFDTSAHAYDVVLLDPPRAGAPGVLSKVLRNRPRRVIYVSCHAPAAARDLRQVTQSGYVLRDVLCFDLFPDTHHIETVMVLDRPR